MKAFVRHLPLLALLLLASCEKGTSYADLGEEGIDGTELTSNETKKFTFTCKGDFSSVYESSSGARKAKGANKAPSYLSENTLSMTDLWVLDYSGGRLLQQLHQASTDEGFGAPTMQLAYGTHHIYFVASRGTDPTLSTDDGTITWAKTSDTFWADYEVTVQKTSNGNRAVTLERVATMLSVTIADELPEGIATVNITPEHWYYGLNYTTGAATADRKQERPVNIPSSKIGQANVRLDIYGISGATEWTTDIAIAAISSDGFSLGSATITGAPFLRNRVTHYTGSLFSESTPMAISLESDWLTPYEGTW